MSMNASHNRFNPSLLRRLTDDHPQESWEGPDQGNVSLQEYRQSVLRDLATLLNTRSPSSESPVHEFARVAESVLNCGLKDIGGSTVSQIDSADLAMQIRLAIQRFEPRITPGTLAVRAARPDEAERPSHTLFFEVEGELRACPAPDRRLRARAELDLETGCHTIRECDDEHG